MAAPMNIDLSIWNHVGYTEGSYETPVRGAAEPSSDNLIYSAVGMRPPAVKDLFSFLKLKASYEDLKGALYLKMTLHYASGSSEVFYGWVDGVSLLSSSYEHIPDSIVNIWDVVGISWHVDLWRTYISKVELGRGVLLRRPAMLTRETPPQNPVYFSKRLGDDPVPLLEPNLHHNIWWIIFSYTYDDGGVDAETVSILYSAVAFSLTRNRDGYYAPVNYGTPENPIGYFPNIVDILNGEWLDKLKISPSRITGAFLSPIPPIPFRYRWDDTYKIHYVEMWDARWGFGASPGKPGRIGLNPEALWENENITGGPFEENPANSHISDTTEDGKEFVLTGFMGEPLAVIPFRKIPSIYRYRLVASATDCYLKIIFEDSGLHEPGYVYQREESALGSLSFDIPLPSVDVSQNSYSEYVYSGARDYYRRQLSENLRYQREVERTDALTSIGIGAATMGIGAADGAATKGPVGAALGAYSGLGGVTGGISTLIGQEVHKNLALEERHNSSLMSQKDAYMAHQTEGLQLSGTGFDVVFFGCPISLAERVIDDYSMENFNKEITSYGYKVFEPEASCDTWVDTAGPIMIDDLNIVPAKISPGGPARYDVPIEAIQYIKARLKRGVLLT